MREKTISCFVKNGLDQRFVTVLFFLDKKKDVDEPLVLACKLVFADRVFLLLFQSVCVYYNEIADRYCYLLFMAHLNIIFTKCSIIAC